jgi:hypothetical protein
VPGYVWYAPIAATILLVISLIYLAVKASKIQKQLSKLNRRTSRFIAGLPKASPIAFKEGIPTISEAKSRRRAEVARRTKNRDARQRRLVEHLKDLQAKESE